MPDYLTVTITPGKAQHLVSAGDGPVLLFNDDPNNTVFIGQDWGVLPNGSNVVPLSPLGTIGLDGSVDAFACIPSGQTATVFVVPGGTNFFQLVEIITKAVIVNSSSTVPSGLFVYLGTGSLGNQPVLAITEDTLDPFGNPTTPLLNIGRLSGAHAGFDNSGRMYLSDATPKVAIELDPVNSNISFYPGGAGIAPATISIAPVAGTDQYGQAFDAGIDLMAAGASGASIFIKGPGTTRLKMTNSTVNNVPLIQWITGVAEEAGPAGIFANLRNAGASEQMDWWMIGPIGSVHQSHIIMLIEGAAADGSQQGGMQIQYVDSAGGGHALFFAAHNGALLVGNTQATHPGSDDTTLATETLQSMSGSLQNSWTVTASGSPPTPVYFALPDLKIQVQVDLTHAAIAGNSQFFTLPTGYIPSRSQIMKCMILAATAGFGTTEPFCTVDVSGNLTFHNLPTGTTRVTVNDSFSMQ